MSWRRFEIRLNSTKVQLFSNILFSFVPIMTSKADYFSASQVSSVDFATAIRLDGQDGGRKLMFIIVMAGPIVDN